MNEIVYVTEWDGSTWFYKNGNLHNNNGPAVIFRDGGKQWYIDNDLHRTNGPAVIRENGIHEWWIRGIRYSELEFNFWMGIKYENTRRINKRSNQTA